MTRLGAALTITLLGTLTACGATAPAKPTAASSHTANVSDVAYLAAVRPHLAGSSDTDVIQVGHQACDSLADKTPLDVAANLSDQGFSTDAAAAITTAAVQTYCPQYKDKLATP